MQLIFDDISVEVKEDYETIVEEVNRYIKESAENDQVVQECLVNNLPVDIGKLANLISENLDGGTLEKIELHTIPRGHLIKNILESTLEYLERINAFVQVSVEQIRTQNQLSPSQWSDFLRGLEWLSRVSSVLNEQRDFGPLASSQLDSIMLELNEILKEMVAALENQDMVLLGDLVEYELTEKLKLVETELVNLLTIIEGKVDHDA